jgi:Arc/MetJ-type ribon-helix-helix transcriptional regulator
MSSESRVQITVKIPSGLHASLTQAINEGKYNNMTAAMITALEKELTKPIRMSKDFQNSDNEVQKLTLELQKNVTELEVMRATFEGIQRLTEEKDKRIDDLTKEVETLNVFAHYFKNVEVKQIEAPTTEKVKPWWRFW